MQNAQCTMHNDGPTMQRSSGPAVQRAARRADQAARAVEGAAGAPVSPAQVKALAATARRAYGTQSALGLADGSFDEWRKAALWDVCQKDSFRTLGQREWEQAIAYFNALAGRDAPKPRDAAAEGDRKRAAWALARDCLAFADEKLFDSPSGAEAYAESIARDVFGRPLESLSAEELRKVGFTLRVRARRRRARAAGAATDGDAAGFAQNRPESRGGPRT